MTDGYKNTPVGKDDENVTLFSIGGIKIKINILLLFITLLWDYNGIYLDGAYSLPCADSA